MTVCASECLECLELVLSIVIADDDDDHENHAQAGLALSYTGMSKPKTGTNQDQGSPSCASCMVA